MQRVLCGSYRPWIYFCQRSFIHDFHESPRRTRMGLNFSFDENGAKDHFDRWKKSFWLAPREWQNVEVSLQRRYLPCWSFSVKGSVTAEAYIESGSWLFGGTEWEKLADSVHLKNVQLSDINVYAAHVYDRQHILEIDLKTENQVTELNPSTVDDALIDEWTIDRDTAFEIAWDLSIVKGVQDLCIKQLTARKKGNYQITSIRFPIDKETQELIYFPVYLVDFVHRDRPFQCLINGRTGQVAGLRQFSASKVMVLLLGILYPLCLGTVSSTISSVIYMLTSREVIIPCTLFLTGITFPISVMVSSQIAKYVRDYSHLYRGKKDIREWLDFKKQNPYLFTDRAFEKQQQQKFSTFEHQRFQKKDTTLNFGPDLYALLGVPRIASNVEIKKAYLIKAKEFHPDRNVGKTDIEEKFKLINQAYAILSDPEQRELFDQYGYDHVKYK